MDWVLYNNRINALGITPKDRILNQTQNLYNRKFSESLSCKDVVINGINTKLMVTSDSNKNSYKKLFQTFPNQIVELGAYITYKNMSWLVTDADVENELYVNGTILLCNWLFKWQDSSGNILSRQSVVLNASQYNSGIEGNKTITLGSNQFMVYLPLDEDTLKLTYDKRVFIDNNYQIPYKITRPDNVSNSYNGDGLICLIMSQDVLSDDDRPDLGLCDYFEPTVQPSTTCEITYLNSPTIYVGGNAKTFTTIFKDIEGNILTDILAIWSTDISVADQTKILFVDKGNNTCTLKAGNDLSLIGKVVRLSVKNSDNTLSSFVDITLKGVI